MRSLLLTLLLICGIAHAQYANTEGYYESKSADLRTVVLDTETGVVAASTVVVSGACSGATAGIGKMEGNTLRFSPYKKAEGADKCVITVEFSKDRNSATLTEGDQCTAYHGAACGWEGQAVRKSKRK